MNHVTLSVPDVDAAVRFYIDVLGCREIARWPEGAYLLAGGMWLTLVAAPNYTHIAFSVPPERFREVADQVRAAGAPEWQTNWTEGDSLYFSDPAGNQLELHATTLAARLRSAAAEPWDGLQITDDALVLATGRDRTCGHGSDA